LLEENGEVNFSHKWVSKQKIVKSIKLSSWERILTRAAVTGRSTPDSGSLY
jgi:hypothetical protein